MTILLYELAGADLSRPFSPHCWKAVMALAHKGLAFERISVPFTKVADVEGGVSKLVPVIKDGARVVADSFDIALYLEQTYPDRPSLFGGSGGVAMARFIERWSQTQLHPFMGSAALMEIHDRLEPEDQAFFRASREKRYGKSLEAVTADREQHLAAFRGKLEPLRSTLQYQPYLGGQSPLFADYIVFGALQWVRIMSTYRFLEPGDVIDEWVGRCLDLHSGLAKGVSAAA